jgi:UDP-N-acetylglucosamine 4,6-dehydratase
MRIGITGISGSLGSALCAELVAAGIGPLVGTTRDEFKAEQIGNRYGGVGGQVRVMIAAEGINDTKKMEQIFRGCEVVVHAAALKRISGSVYAATEMIETNVNGTLSVIRAATNAGVSKVLVISSDKAVQATNLYGATKFIGECLAVQENAFSYPRGTRIACCRYGNVMGSRGSVIPIWKDAIAHGQPLLVTHEHMTRFLITMKAAVDFVMASIFSMKGGEIFVPLLPTATMVDLATAVANGRADVLVKNELRPGGEKLAESLLSEEEPVRTVHRTLHGGFSGGIDTYVVLPTHRTWSTEPYPGCPVSHDLVYRSDTVERRLTVDELRLLL